MKRKKKKNKDEAVVQMAEDKKKKNYFDKAPSFPLLRVYIHPETIRSLVQLLVCLQENLETTDEDLRRATWKVNKVYFSSFSLCQKRKKNETTASQLDVHPHLMKKKQREKQTKADEDDRPVLAIFLQMEKISMGA